MRQLERRVETISGEFNSLQLCQMNPLCTSCDLKEGPICLPRHETAGSEDGASVREHDRDTASCTRKNDATHVLRRCLMVTCPGGLHW